MNEKCSILKYNLHYVTLGWVKCCTISYWEPQTDQHYKVKGSTSLLVLQGGLRKYSTESTKSLIGHHHTVYFYDYFTTILYISSITWSSYCISLLLHSIFSWRRSLSLSIKFVNSKVLGKILHYYKYINECISQEKWVGVGSSLPVYLWCCFTNVNCKASMIWLT